MIIASISRRDNVPWTSSPLVPLEGAGVQESTCHGQLTGSLEEKSLAESSESEPDPAHRPRDGCTLGYSPVAFPAFTEQHESFRVSPLASRNHG